MEIVVSIGVLMVLTATVLISFRSSEGGRQLNNARALVVNYIEGVRADTRSGRLHAGNVPRGAGMTFSAGERMMIHYGDPDGCGLTGDEQTIAEIDLPEGVSFAPGEGVHAVQFFAPFGDLLIDPRCGQDPCVAPCRFDEVVGGAPQFSLRLLYDRTGEEQTVTFNTRTGAVE